MRAKLVVVVLAATLLSCGAWRGRTSDPRDTIASTGVVDLDQLTTRETLLLIEIVEVEASPCEGEISLLETLEKPDPCPRALRALGFIYRRILEGYGREDVLDQYVARFKQADVVELDLEGCPDTGPADASITITVFSDFQCPYCRKAAGVVDDVEKAHPDDVRVVFKHLPLDSIHPLARGASLAAAAAHMQGRFWEMHDALFAREGDVGPEGCEEAALDAGLDMERWREDMESPEAQDLVDRDYEQARDLGLNATPTIFVSGMEYDEPLKYLDQVVEELLLD